MTDDKRRELLAHLGRMYGGSAEDVDAMLTDISEAGFMLVEVGHDRESHENNIYQRARADERRKAAEIARTYPDPDEDEGQAYACGWVDASVNIAAAIEAQEADG